MLTGLYSVYFVSCSLAETCEGFQALRGALNPDLQGMFGVMLFLLITLSAHA